MLNVLKRALKSLGLSERMEITFNDNSLLRSLMSKINLDSYFPNCTIIFPGKINYIEITYRTGVLIIYKQIKSVEDINYLLTASIIEDRLKEAHKLSLMDSTILFDVNVPSSNVTVKSRKLCFSTHVLLNNNVSYSLVEKNIKNSAKITSFFALHTDKKRDGISISELVNLKG